MFDRAGNTELASDGIRELDDRCSSVEAAGYGTDRIRIDPSVVRGLEYYTGPVFEAELTFEVKDETASPCASARSAAAGATTISSPASPARRFRPPASPSASRACRPRSRSLGTAKTASPTAPSSSLVMEKDRVADYQKLVQTLRTRRHPRRAVPRLVRHEGADEVRRQARLALRRHPGLGRARQGRGDAQGPRSKARRPPPPSRTTRNGRKRAPRRSPSRRPISSPRCARSSPATRRDCIHRHAAQAAIHASSARFGDASTAACNSVAERWELAWMAACAAMTNWEAAALTVQVSP